MSSVVMLEFQDSDIDWLALGMVEISVNLHEIDCNLGCSPKNKLRCTLLIFVGKKGMAVVLDHFSIFTKPLIVEY